jgi:peptidoglycan/LPS O-acetylase OafA/YrhL
MVGIDPSLVTHFWSLAIEEQFYFVYPLIVFVLTWLAPIERRTQVLRVFLLAVVVASALYSAQLTPIDPVTAYYSPLTRFWELALGGLMTTLPSSWRSPYPRVTQTVAWAAAGLVVLSMVITTPVGFPGTAAWLPCAATALLLRTGDVHNHSGVSKLLAVRPLRYIGDISYSLYLWHFAWLMLPKQMPNVVPSTSLTIMGLVGTFACAAASYHWLENPIRHSHKPQNDGLATGLLLLVALAISLDATIVIESLWLNQ